MAAREEIPRYHFATVKLVAAAVSNSTMCHLGILIVGGNPRFQKENEEVNLLIAMTNLCANLACHAPAGSKLSSTRAVLLCQFVFCQLADRQLSSLGEALDRADRPVASRFGRSGSKPRPVITVTTPALPTGSLILMAGKFTVFNLL